MLRGRDIDVAPPYPHGAVGTCVNQRSRLRVMDHRKLRFEIQLLRILAIALDKRVIHFRCDSLCRPLERVVKTFCRTVKEIGSYQHFPSNLDSQFLEEWKKPMEDLRYPATEPRRIDMHHACSCDSASKFPQQFHGSLWGNVSIIFKHSGHLIDMVCLLTGHVALPALPRTDEGFCFGCPRG